MDHTGNKLRNKKIRSLPKRTVKNYTYRGAYSESFNFLKDKTWRV